MQVSWEPGTLDCQADAGCSLPWFFSAKTKLSPGISVMGKEGLCGQCWFTTPGTHHGLTGSWCSMNSCRALPHLFSLAFCVLTVEKCRRRCPNIQVLLLRLGCLSFWQKQPAVQETMTDDKGTCHFELPENTRTPVCLVLHLCVVRTISMNKPVKYLAQGYPGQKCFIQEKEPSLTIFCLLDNIR